MMFAKVIKLFPCIQKLEAAKEQNRESCLQMINTLKMDSTKQVFVKAFRK